MKCCVCLCILGLRWMVIMTGMDWILCSSTPERSGHQSVLTKAFCNKRGGGERYWLPWMNISKSLSLSFFMCVFICLSLLSLPLLIFLHLPQLMLPPSPIRPPSNPFSYHLFITDLFILYSSSLGTVHAVTVSCWFLSSFLHSLIFLLISTEIPGGGRGHSGPI